MDRPPIEHFLDEHTEIIPTADGFALETALVRVNLSDTLISRLAINVLASKRRTAADA